MKLIIQLIDETVNIKLHLFTRNTCCIKCWYHVSDSGSSFLETLFSDWVQKGTVVILDIRHWLHRCDTVVIKQSHAKNGAFMSALAGAVLAYNKEDMMRLGKAVRSGNQELYATYSDKEMISFLKPCQIRSYVRCITRGVDVSVKLIHIFISWIRSFTLDEP